MRYWCSAQALHCNLTFNHNLTGVGLFVGFGVTGFLVGLGCVKMRKKRESMLVSIKNIKITIAKNHGTYSRTASWIKRDRGRIRRSM